MHTKFPTIFAFAASAVAKQPSDSRTYAVNYFTGTDPLLEGRYDPIVSPGMYSSHVHTIMGGDAFSMSMGEETALGANCTNSMPKADKAGNLSLNDNFML